MIYYAPHFFILEYLRIHTFGISIFMVNNIFNKVFTTLFWDILYFTSGKQT